MKEVTKRSAYNSVFDIQAGHLLDALPEATFICNPQGLVVSCSAEVVRFFSLADKEKVIGSNFQSYFSFDTVEEANLYFLLATKTHNRHSGKLLVKKNFNEARPAHVSFSYLQNDTLPGNYVLIIFREVSGAETAIDELNKKGARLSRICDTLLGCQDQPFQKQYKLLSQVGETLSAVTCSYFRVDNGILNLIAAWESPFNPGISPLISSRQIFDYSKDKEVPISLIRMPLLRAFLEPESQNPAESGVKTLIGISVGPNTKTEGIVTAAFTSNIQLSEDDEQFLLTVAALIAEKYTSENVRHTTVGFSYNELIDCFHDPIYILSTEGMILDVNKSVTINHGYDREDLVGKLPLFFSDEEMNEKDQIARGSFQSLNDETLKTEWWGKCKNGVGFPIEIKFSTSRYFEQEVILAIVRDLTDTKQTEKELIRYNKELEESNNSKDKFFSILAHDLKNPFQGLLGFIDLLYDDLDELSIAQVKEYLANVRNASYHTYALLENLLEWSRIQSGKMPFNPSVFNIHDQINSVILVLENNARTKNIRLLNEVENNITVNADRNMIHSVIQNLVTNSIKFSNPRGRVIIRGRESHSLVSDKDKTETELRNWLEVSISDDGIGIPEEILPRLFKLNGQYSQSGTANEPGTGLGLVLCHEMVEKNGGRIWAESVAGQGTTFIFTIPLNN